MYAAVEKAMANAGTHIPSLRTNVEHLSGGQRQAIELNRFVHWGGKLVLLDEPFAALGVEQTRRGLDMVKRIAAQGIGVVIITHIMAQAFQVADRIVVIRQGVVAGNVHETKTQSRRSRAHDYRRGLRGTRPRNAAEWPIHPQNKRRRLHETPIQCLSGALAITTLALFPSGLRAVQGKDLLHGSNSAR